MNGDTLIKIDFNEEPGSTVAHDHSGNGHNLNVTGGEFIPGRQGNALHLSLGGFAEKIGTTVIDLSLSFTLTAWLLADQITFEGGLFPTASYILFMNSDQEYLYLDLKSDLSSWTYICLIKDNDKIFVFVNGEEADSKIIPDGWGDPIGFCFLTNNPNDGAGEVSIDDFIAYEGANYSKRHIPIISMDLNYTLNGTDFKEFGVYVTESNGILDNLKMKEPFTANWDNVHGEVIDLTRPRYEARDIVLKCFIKATGKDQFQDRVKEFIASFQKPGTQRLMIKAHATKPLVFECYVKESININKRWSDSTMVGTFELKLREPEPIKKVIKFIGPGTLNISYSSAKSTNIYWGDGTSVKDNFGSVSKSKNYSSAGEYYTLITGVIEDITGFSTNGIVTWAKL